MDNYFPVLHSVRSQHTAGSYECYIEGNKFSEVVPSIDRKRKIGKLISFTINTTKPISTTALVREHHQTSCGKFR